MGRDGRYVVQWNDAYFFGSQGFALVNELERAGFDVGMYEPWHVPVTQHRVIPFDETTAELVMATGGFVDQWRADDRVVEIASFDPRTDAEREQFEALRDDLIAELEANGLDDLVPDRRHEPVRRACRSAALGTCSRGRRPPAAPRAGDRTLHRPARGGDGMTVVAPATPSVAADPSIDDRVRRWGWKVIAAATSFVILLSAVRGIRRGYEAIGDNALIELRGRDVLTGNHPLLGTWSSASISSSVDVNHPGPLLFDVVALPVRLFGGAAGIALAIAALNIAVVWTVGFVTRRARAGRPRRSSPRSSPPGSSGPSGANCSTTPGSRTCWCCPSGS